MPFVRIISIHLINNDDEKDGVDFVIFGYQFKIIPKSLIIILKQLPMADNLLLEIKKKLILQTCNLTCTFLELASWLLGLTLGSTRCINNAEK